MTTYKERGVGQMSPGVPTKVAAPLRNFGPKFLTPKRHERADIFLLQLADGLIHRGGTMGLAPHT